MTTYTMPRWRAFSDASLWRRFVDWLLGQRTPRTKVTRIDPQMGEYPSAVIQRAEAVGFGRFTDQMVDQVKEGDKSDHSGFVVFPMVAGHYRILRVDVSGFIVEVPETAFKHTKYPGQWTVAMVRPKRKPKA